MTVGQKLVALYGCAALVIVGGALFVAWRDQRRRFRDVLPACPDELEPAEPSAVTQLPTRVVLSVSDEEFGAAVGRVIDMSRREPRQ